MVGVLQYPDVLTYQKVTAGGSHYDEDGNLIIDPPTTETITMRCRAEANSGNKYINGTDGQRLLFDWTVYIKKSDASPIPAGATITVSRNGVQRASGTVQRFVIDQLNARAWV